MKSTIKYTIITFILGMLMTACGGTSDTPAPVVSLVGNTWTLATVNSSNDSDEKTTFVLQDFTLSEGGTYAATLYPSTPVSGTWTENGTTYNLDISGSDISLNNVSIDGNILNASIVVAAGVGGKTAEFSGTVTYTK